jgi:ribosomal protein L11 methyltransferase
VPSGCEEALGFLLHEAGGLTAEIQPRRGRLRCLAWVVDRRAARALHACYRRLAADLDLPRAPRAWAEDEVVERDWQRRWVESWRPQRIAGFHILAPWHQPAPKPGAQPIVLVPGRAFGTGEHETTRLCLRLVRKYLRPGQAVLDLGTGSGILALAAAALGGRVLAIDIDPEAVAAARENAALNPGLQGHIRFRRASTALLAECAGRYGLVLANLELKTLSELAGRLLAVLKPAGRLIASGILTSQVAALRAELARQGGIELDRRRLGEWAAVVFGRG